jgi:hypothetical protein
MVEHRAGPLRQSNKPHKPGKHKSNRSRDFTGRGVSLYLLVTVLV